MSTVKKQNCKKEISKTSDTNHQIQDSQIESLHSSKNENQKTKEKIQKFNSTGEN